MFQLECSLIFTSRTEAVDRVAITAIATCKIGIRKICY